MTDQFTIAADGIFKRTHMCGELNETLAGQSICITGWVHKQRDLSHCVFIVLRDRSGLVQIAFDKTATPKPLVDKALAARGEYVIGIRGKVTLRAENAINHDMATGKIEIIAEDMQIISEAETPPFQLLDEGVREDVRLKYRYLDLRRPELQRNLQIRHAVYQTTRKFLCDEGFWEIETPILANSSPEGARDYLVPSRTHPGQFYALPQSPQVFKQLLMASGVDKYFQIAKCFRDEDLRADRQPEFTQIDIEMSFVDMEDIFALCEKLIGKIFKEAAEFDLPQTFRRMTYNEAMERFGVDKPDLRFDMELCDISEIVAGSEFAVFQGALDAGGSVRGICVTGQATLPRKQIDQLVEFAKGHGAKGLAWINYMENGEIKSTISKFFDENKLKEILTKMNAKPGDLVLLCADNTSTVFDALGALRVEVAKRMGILDATLFEPVWITDFPLLEYSEEDNRYYAKHHPFTAPMDEDLHMMETGGKDLANIRAKAYDLVINGYETLGGSIRIYQRSMQNKMFDILQISPEQAEAGFGHLLEAFKYGYPPTGGAAAGLDRICMLLCGDGAIRDVIAFPKVKDASCPLTKAPNAVDPKQLDELYISVTTPPAEGN